METVQLRKLTLKQRIEEELRAIQHTNGILRPKDVVRFARKHPESALHSQFEWDVERAAEKYLLEQARRVIRVHVVIHEQVADPMRVFVSMDADRVNRGGGYRLAVDVMSVKEQRAQLLHQALRELKRWREKYQTLSEFAKVFEALEDLDAA